jgi:hypothetical protein
MNWTTRSCSFAEQMGGKQQGSNILITVKLTTQ